MFAEIELELVCAECGEGLDVEQKQNRDLEVMPCESCIKDARNEGYDEGYSEGEAEALN